ncbi:MAG TPA: hypothetical protein VEQ11_06875 [Chloroflexota bacterium]|nr:hypothetical protein [Chloroflexota bacterium]
MPKKARRRPIRRRRQAPSQDAAEQQRSLDAAARNMLSTVTPVQLRSELSDRELLLDEADRAAQLDPNPINLARYRFARAQRDTARRALELAEGQASQLV